MKPQYTFKNGDKVCVGFKCYQCLDGKLVEVLCFTNIAGEVSRTYYIPPGNDFTYEILGSNQDGPRTAAS